MKRAPVAAAVAALALATFFWFPGHTWLQQDSQIYIPILEHQRDPALLRNDMIAQHPHDAFTLYDEIAFAARRATGLGFREVLQFQQIVSRALGIWGLLLLGEAFGLSLWQAFAAAAICSLGVTVAGPTVLTLEYEPTPRAFAVPLILLAIGLAARRKDIGASLAGSVAFLYHAPTTLPFWAVFAVVLARRRAWRAFLPPAVAALILLAAARGEYTGGWYGRLTSAEEQLQRMRASYVWISMWPAAVILNYVVLFAVSVAAFLRVRGRDWTLLAIAALGVLTMPLSWALLEGAKWALVPQVQPMRALLFTALALQFFAAVAGLRARRWYEAFAWLAVAFLLPVQPVVTEAWAWRPVAVALALAALGAARFRHDRSQTDPTSAEGKRLTGAPWAESSQTAFAVAAATAAFAAVPMLGGVVNYPRLHTPELAQLSAWARASTPLDAVFLFPDARRRVEPGIFRSEALRAVYVDWKAGGQLNYIREFGEEWWFRWQQTMVPKFTPGALPKFGALGVQYIVVQPKNRLRRPALFENASYAVYRVAD